MEPGVIYSDAMHEDGIPAARLRHIEHDTHPPRHQGL